jgi:hypothetical protein
VTFINPSVRDYLTDYLDDAALLETFAKAARKADWAEAVWRHTKKSISAERHKSVAVAFKAIAPSLPHLPVMKRDPIDPTRYHFYDSSMSSRVRLLLEWYRISADALFSETALLLAQHNSSAFYSWSDGTTLVRLVRDLRTEPGAEFAFAAELADALEGGIIGIFDRVWADDLGTMWDAIENERDVLCDEVFEAARSAVARGIEEARSSADASDSESTLDDHIKTLQRLAPQADIPPAKLAYAVSQIQERIAEISERTEEADSPSFSGHSPREVDKFDDVALRNLFAPLVRAR